VTDEDIVAHNQRHLRQKGRLKMFSASTATLSIRHADEYRQICQIGFNGDGSIRVAWPYLPVEQGIVAACEIPVGSTSQRIELQHTGKFTSQRVKFSHHTSGQAHFSLTGRTSNEIRRPSFPLTGPIGRIFELTAVFPAGFSPLARGGAAFRRSIQLQATDWAKAASNGAELCIAGDLNQEYSANGPVGTRAGRAVLDETLESLALTCATGEPHDPLHARGWGRSIDHILLSKTLRVVDNAPRIWPEQCPLPKGWPDHHGVALTIACGHDSFVSSNAPSHSRPLADTEDRRPMKLVDEK
jgi:hypothetical protein